MLRFLISLRKYSTKCPKTALGDRSLVEAVAVSENGKTILAWHPEREYPYEYTKPIPPPSIQQSSAIIKEESMETAMRAFKDKRPEVAREELMKLTSTTKHRWFPRKRDNRAKKTPMDRPYL